VAVDAPKRRETILSEFSANRIIIPDDISPTTANAPWRFVFVDELPDLRRFQIKPQTSHAEEMFARLHVGRRNAIMAPVRDIPQVVFMR
jgi:hypothetical protein